MHFQTCRNRPPVSRGGRRWEGTRWDNVKDGCGKSRERGLTAFMNGVDDDVINGETDTVGNAVARPVGEVVRGDRE